MQPTETQQLDFSLLEATIGDYQHRATAQADSDALKAMTKVMEYLNFFRNSPPNEILDLEVMAFYTEGNKNEGIPWYVSEFESEPPSLDFSIDIGVDYSVEKLPPLPDLD